MTAMMARSPQKTAIDVTSSNDDRSSIRMDEAWQVGIRQRRGVGLLRDNAYSCSLEFDRACAAFRAWRNWVAAAATCEGTS
jgi:hypothetical protein